MINDAGLLITAITGSATAAVLIPTAIALARELPRAIRETRARQRRLHPHPEEERAVVRELAARRREQESRTIEERLERFRSVDDTSCSEIPNGSPARLGEVL